MSSPAARGNYNGSNTVPGVACCTLARVGAPTCYVQCDIVTVLLHAMKMLRRMRCHAPGSMQELFTAMGCVWRAKQFVQTDMSESQALADTIRTRNICEQRLHLHRQA